MTWFVRARHPLAILVVIALATVVSLVLVDVVLPIPQLAGPVTLGVPAALFAPAFSAAAIVAALSESPRPVDEGAARPVRWLDRLFVTASTVLGAVILTVLGVLLEESLLVAGARNLVGYVGIGLLARALVGPRPAAVAPVAVAVFVGTFGQSVDPALWAWPLHAAGSTASAVVALGMFVGGAAVMSTRAHPR